jgi:restriction system protein
MAIGAASSYLLAHAQELPDGRYAGMVDALALIRARYIGLPSDEPSERTETMLKLSSRAFERLVERYLHAQDYSTRLTPASKDGGRDVIAKRSSPPPLQRLLVECKNWVGRVGRPTCQQLLGEVSAEKAPNGMLVATSGFTAPARSFARDDPRITLLGGDELVREFNRVLGADWPARIDQLLLESEAHAP